jgi:Flp pilus assembly protein TadD
MRYVSILLSTLVSLSLVNITCAQERQTPASSAPDSGTLRCLVQDNHGRPLAEVPVELRTIAPPMERIRGLTSADGFVVFEFVDSGSWELTAAGGILSQAKHVQVAKGADQNITLRLPVTLANAPGHLGQTVSVQQLSVPERVRDTLYQAYDAWRRNDLHQSRTLAMRALEMKPYYGPAMSLLGILELQEGHPAEAVSGLLEALPYNPDSVRSYIALASACNQLRKHVEALDALAIARNLVPDSWQVRYETGRAYLGLGQFERALVEFEHADELSSPDAVVLHVGKAHALLGLKDLAGARAELEMVLKKDPKGPYAAESRSLAQQLDSQIARRSPTVLPVQAAANTQPAR